jgi:phospholipase/carboxylesterase
MQLSVLVKSGSSMSTMLETVEIETQSNPQYAVIWLHGLGADGNDFAPIIPELKLPSEVAVRFIFPHAPVIPVTINGGMAMRAWYDILSMNIDRQIDTPQLVANSECIRLLIEKENSRGIACENIIIAGFSQGGAVAYQTALEHPKKLAGIMALSTYFATKDTIKPNQANQDIPVQVYHGTLDPVVPEVLGQQAVSALKTLGYQVAYETYQMQHQVCPQQIAHISQWIQSVFKPK